MAERVAVGSLDVAMAGDPVWVVVGPVAGDVERRFPDVLARMAAQGPRFRVGLIPTARGRLWEYTDKPGTLLKADLSGAHTPEQILERLVGRPAPAPITVAQVGAYACVCFDHGIGDSHVMMEVLAALAAAGSPRGFVEPVPNPPITDRPFRTALTTYVRNSRRGIPMAEFAKFTCVTVGHKVRRAFRDLADSRGQVTTHRGCEVIHVVSVPRLRSTVRAWRDGRHPGASVTSTIILSIHRALRDAGIHVADELDVLVDLRRLLPPGVETLANLCTIAKVEAGANVTVDEFSARFRARTSSGWPLIKTAAHLNLNRIAFALGSHPKPKGRLVAEPPGSRTIEVTVSDISKIPATAKLRFATPDAATLAVALPPGSDRSLTLALWVSSAGQVQATATLPSGLIDREILRGALENGLSPARFGGNLCQRGLEDAEAIAP
jgi:hypothetical protein